MIYTSSQDGYASLSTSFSVNCLAAFSLLVYVGGKVHTWKRTALCTLLWSPDVSLIIKTSGQDLVWQTQYAHLSFCYVPKYHREAVKRAPLQIYLAFQYNVSLHKWCFVVGICSNESKYENVVYSLQNNLCMTSCMCKVNTWESVSVLVINVYWDCM